MFRHVKSFPVRRICMNYLIEANTHPIGALLLTGFNFNYSMDK